MPPFTNLRELEPLAAKVLAKHAFDYVAGGAGEERNLRANETAWSKYVLRPRVLVDVSKRSLATTVLGERVAFPVLVAPTAFHKLMHADGEPGVARAAHATGTLFISSTLATTPLEEVAASTPGPKWFQLYVYKDRDITLRLIDRAKRAGYKALVLTVDTAVWGRRERDVRNGFTLPDRIRLANFFDLARSKLPDEGAGTDGLAKYVTEQLNPALTWRDLDWLREVSGMPVVVKGVVAGEDARLAVEHGAAGVVVSNHGGRQLDAGIATLDALPEVVAAVDGRAEVYVDGGVRRGSDALVALALGARAVLVGRPVLWGLALDGEAGARRALETLRDELDNAMALSGITSPGEATPALVRRA